MTMPITSVGTGFVYAYLYSFIQHCLAAIPQFSRKFLTTCVQSRKNPRKSAVFRDEPGRYGTHSHLLENNEAYVIIMLYHRLYNKDYVVAKEQQIPMHFVASAQPEFADRKGLSVRDIIEEPFVLTEYGQGCRCVFDRELAKKSLEITPVLEIGQTDIITSVLMENDRISYLPDFVTGKVVLSQRCGYEY